MLSKTSDTADSEEHKTSPTILIKLSGHFKRILKNCYKMMKKILTTKNLKKAQKSEMLHQEEKVEETEDTCPAPPPPSPAETSVTSLQEEKPGRAESTVNKHLTFLQATKEILEKQLEEIVNDAQSYSTEEEDSPSCGSLGVCPFKEIASNISSGKLESSARTLSDILANHLKPQKVQEETDREEIRAEVDNIFKDMGNWLKKQIQLCKIRKDCVNMTLKKFRQLVLNNHLSSPKTEAEDQTCPTPVQEEVQSFTAEKEEEEACKAEEEKEEACSDEEEKEEAYTAEEQVEQAQVAKPSGECTESVQKEWDRLTCEFIVKLFIRKLTKDLFPNQTYKLVEARLTDVLYEKMIGTSVNVDLSLKSIKKKCKAVYKELCKNVDGGVLWRSLLVQGQPVIEAAAEALKKHFSSERPSGIQKLLRCFAGLSLSVVVGNIKQTFFPQTAAISPGTPRWI
ncbi:uncharacterized protein LOC117808509 [Xyrichtys novacula]|uniref:Uncharacterized protein LOC117808509 n=1 Tax=Xyrichtys novacula TaxID=13765 RepID=A0AAV1FBG2_XYRNO|nr:uncharacterized protein LOC117808509 [Xyrichtys novacula]